MHSDTSQEQASEAPNEKLKAVFNYALLRWRVFPCRPRRKDPLSSHGVMDATTDLAQITAWWTRWPDANIGIATGAVSGFFVLDVDPKNGGNESLDSLVKKHGPLLETVQACTGGGGHHYLFRQPGFRVKNSAGSIAPGLDIRGDGGYIIAPPSTHPSGRPYEWEVTHGPDDIEIAPAPSWLLEEIRVVDTGERTRKTTGTSRPIPEGQRNETLFKLACAMRAKGMSAEAIFEALRIENTQRCRPPLSDDEVWRIATSASKYKPRSESHAKDEDDDPVPFHSPSNNIEPFPLETLPEPLQKLVEEGAKTLHCPPDYIAVPLLTLAGAAIGATRVIEIKRGWRESPAIYSAVVALPGTKKSPALKLAATALTLRQAALYKQYKEAKAKYQLELAKYEIDLASWKSRVSKGTARAEDKPKEPEEPLLEQVLTTDATLESLASLLENNSRGITYFCDELAAWVRSFNQYKNGRGADRQTWLSFWNNAQVIVNRKARRDPIVLTAPFVSVTGCLQPDILSELSDERGREDGFIHRILFSYPDPFPGKWTEDELDLTVIDGLRTLFTTLYTLAPDNAEGKTIPQVLCFSAEAKAQWREWVAAHYQEQEQENFSDSLRGPWAKLEAYCARLALIIHCCRIAAGETAAEHIEGEDIASAWALIDYFKTHSRKVYAQLRTTPEDQRALRVRQWIEKHNNRTSARDLLRANVAGLKTASEAKKLLNELIDRGWGKIEKEGKREIFILYSPDTRQSEENEERSSA